MDSTLPSAIPLLFLLAALIYAALVGNRIHGSTGGVSVFGISVTLLGLIAGWLLERFLPAESAGEDWAGSRTSRLAVELLFSFVAAFTFLAVTLAKRDFDVRTEENPAPRRAFLLVPLFLLAVGIAARGKLSAFLVVLFYGVSK